MMFETYRFAIPHYYNVLCGCPICHAAEALAEALFGWLA